MKIRIDSYLPITDVEGPGRRFCIWVQGCSIHCKGCANKHMWSKRKGTLYDARDLVKIITEYKDKIEGITFLGGEPLEQIDAVTYISKEVKKLDLTVLLFTGYNYDEISVKDDFKELVKNIDILIDGKYEQDKRDFSRPWVGSTNQKYYFFSDKYNEDIIKTYKNKFEIRIDRHNKISVNGMGKFEELSDII